MIGIGLGVVGYLNHRKNPRWIQFCRSVDGFMKVCRFILLYIWDWGLISIGIATRGPPPSVLPALPTPEANLADPVGENEEDGEEYFLASDKEVEPEVEAWGYPMTDDED